MVAALKLGSLNIASGDIIDILLNGYNNISMEDERIKIHDIIWFMRMPRVLLAVFIGAGLSVSGVVMQALVKNPLADPYILGISSGASLGATMAIMLGSEAIYGEGLAGACAFVGAFFVSLTVVFCANIGGSASSVKLLLAGMGMSAICSAFSSFVVYYSGNMFRAQNIAFWLMGNLAGASYKKLAFFAVITVVVILFFCTQSRILNIMLLGDETAITLGYSIKNYRQVYLLVNALMIGFAVYCAGMIGFIGFLIPHIVRTFTGSDYKTLIPMTALVGAIFTVWADVLCRVILPRSELPIGLLISLIGAPCFVYLMVKRAYAFNNS